MSEQRTLTGAPPRTIDGVIFRCYRTGLIRRLWISDDGRCRVGSSYNLKTYWARADGESVGYKYRKQENAMKGAVKALTTESK